MAGRIHMFDAMRAKYWLYDARFSPLRYELRLIFLGVNNTDNYLNA